MRVTGRLTACDPLLQATAMPLQVSLPPGRHAVLVATCGDVPAALMLSAVERVSAATVWELVAFEEGDAVFPVDSGTACLADWQGLSEHGAATALAGKARRLRFPFLARGAAGHAFAACVSPGDGGYATYVGRDEGGRPVALVVDFGELYAHVPFELTFAGVREVARGRLCGAALARVGAELTFENFAARVELVLRCPPDAPSALRFDDGPCFRGADGLATGETCDDAPWRPGGPAHESGRGAYFWRPPPPDATLVVRLRGAPSPMRFVTREAVPRAEAGASLPGRRPAPPAVWTVLRHPDGRQWSVRRTRDGYRLRMASPGEVPIVRSRKARPGPEDDVSALIAEQLADGFMPQPDEQADDGD
jgi:hypothetical protein